MTYLIGYHALWLIAALALGVVVGAATFERYRDRLMDLIVWAFVIAWLIGAYLALTRALPDRAGYALELGLLMSFAYGVGCFVGWLLHSVTTNLEPELAAAGGHHHKPTPAAHTAERTALGDATKSAPVAEAPKPAPAVDAPKPAPSVETSKPAPAAEAPRPALVADAPKPAPSVEASKPAPAAEAPKPALAAETPKPALVVEAPTPAPSVDVSKPAPVAEAPKLAPVVDALKPAPSVEASKPVLAVETSKASLDGEAHKPAVVKEASQAAQAVTSEDDKHTGTRPLGLASPDGLRDDLKRIRGIGPQNEGRLHGLGIWHFRQIAAWTPDNVEWVGSYLAFPGRIDREEWVQQAKVLATGAETEFSKRVDAGEVPTSVDDGSAGRNNIEKVAPRDA